MGHDNVMRSLAQKIKESFCLAVPPEVPDSLDQYRDYFLDTQSFWGKTWEEMTLAQFEKFPLIFGSLPTDLLPHFLGAYMYLSLAEPSSKLDSLAYICENPILMKQKKYRNRPKMQSVRTALSEMQLEIFKEYLSYIADNFSTPHLNSFRFSNECLIKATPITQPTG